MCSMAHMLSAGGLCERVAPGIAGKADSRQANARSRAQGLLCRPRAGAAASLCGKGVVHAWVWVGQNVTLLLFGR